MFKKIISKRLISVFSMFVFCATLGIHPSTSLADDKAPGSSNDSFFQGVWVGEWTGHADPSIRQGVTLEIGQKIRDGVYEVNYSWEAANYRSGNVPAGKIKTEGMVKDDTIHFSWENKQGKKFEMMLKKRDDATLNARMERPGPTGPMGRPYSETILKRK